MRTAQHNDGNAFAPLGKFAYFISIVFLLIAYFIIEDGFSKFVVWPCLLIYYFILVRAFLRPVEIAHGIPTYFTIEALFLISYFVVFYYPYQLALLGLLDSTASSYLVYTYVDQANAAVILSTIGALAFVSGIRMRRTFHAGPKRVPLPVPFLHAATLISLIALIGIYYAAGWRSESVGRYTDTAAGGVAANGVYNLITMFSIITVAECVRALGSRKLGPALAISALVVIAWTVDILLDGDRNSFFLIAATAAGGVLTYQIKGRRTLLIGMLAGSMLLYNSVEALRMSETRSFSELVQIMIIGDVEATPRDSSLTLTAITLRASLAVTPHQENYGFGKYQAVGAAGVIPFIRGALIPESVRFTDTSQVLNYYILGENAQWSVGTNLLSDTYMDFGPLGVPILLFLLGWFAATMQRRASAAPNSQVERILYLMTLAFFTQYPRYAVSLPLTTLVWSAALMFGLQKLFISSLQHHPRGSRNQTPRRLSAAQERNRLRRVE